MITITCKVCGETISTSNLRKTVCNSPVCKKLRHRARSIRENEKRYPQKLCGCLVCGNAIPHDSNRYRYCSEICYKYAMSVRYYRNKNVSGCEV